MRYTSSEPLPKTDIVIIGAGIHGAILAYEAARYGYRVSLFEKEDFGGSTSANSLKIVHGGIRYLQHLNIKRMRESIRSRRSMMQFAPHLVQPLPCLMPTYGHGLKGRETMRVAFALYDLIAADRNEGLPGHCQLPAGGSLSRDRCLEEIPDVNRTNLNGAALWYDGIARNTERLLQEYLNEAERYGAALHNYYEVTGITEDDNKVTGVEVRDHLSKASFSVQSRLVINTSGPWVDTLTGSLTRLSPVTSGRWAKAINIIVKKRLFETFAVGLEGWSDFVDKDAFIKRGKRLFFFVPWQNDYTMIGTSYKPADRSRPQLIDTEDVVEMINDINKIYPKAAIGWDDVTFVHGGLLPQQEDSSEQLGSDSVQPEKATRIVDHGKTDGVDGIVSISGVKYTTAPDIAWKTLKLLRKKIGAPVQQGTYVRSARTGPPRDHTSVINQLGQEYDRIINHLKTTYGSHWRNVFDYLEVDEDGTVEESRWLSQSPDLLKAEVRYFIRSEKAVRLTDVIRRRSSLGSAQCPPNSLLHEIAEFMADDLKWSADDCIKEVSGVQESYYPLVIKD